MKKKQLSFLVFAAFLLVFLLILLLFLVRFFSGRQLDDVSPKIPCDISLLKKADVFYIIPKFNNKSILENKKWCEEILSLNKTLALHGVYHTYNEFLEDRDEKYLDEGINIFQNCFNLTPTRFKPPHLKISKSNKNLIEKRMKLNLKLNQIFHKVYHCNDSKDIPNWVVDLL